MNETESSSQGAVCYFFESKEDTSITDTTEYTLGEKDSWDNGNTVTLGNQ
jgi:hypothetical protein